jgi:hypothetical protein
MRRNGSRAPVSAAKALQPHKSSPVRAITILVIWVSAEIDDPPRIVLAASPTQEFEGSYAPTAIFLKFDARASPLWRPTKKFCCRA